MSNFELIPLIERLGMLLRNECRSRATSHSLAEIHIAILDYLARCNRFSNRPKSVSDYLGLTQGTVSQSIKLLEKKGYLQRGRDQSDGRIRTLSLTPAGRKVVQDIYSDVWQSVLADLPHEHVEITTVTLRNLLRGLQRQNSNRTFLQCASCRHLLKLSDGGRQCGLTGEPLEPGDLEKICYEHELTSSLP